VPLDRVANAVKLQGIWLLTEQIFKSNWPIWPAKGYSSARHLGNSHYAELGIMVILPHDGNLPFYPLLGEVCKPRV
jgi:hypothetical protein